MWLERFGTVDERIFIGFGVISGIIVILAVINMFLSCCQTRPPPGHSVTILHISSTVVICAAVLFRGVQSSWGSLGSLRPLCPVFTALMLVGYTTFAASVMSQSWAIIFKYKCGWWREWKVTFTVWTLVIVAGICVIIWVIVFSPDVTWRQTTDVSVYDQNIYVCGGWGGTSSRDHHQFVWRVTFSVYFAFILLLAVISVPIHCTLGLKGKSDNPFRMALVTSIVNSTLCVIVGLIVWFQLHRDPYDDSYKYAIIGSLQLWMLFVSQLALLIAEALSRQSHRSHYEFNKREYANAGFSHDDGDKVSVSDGDGTLNYAMTANYYE